MTGIFDRQIDHPSAWTSQGIGGKAGITRTLQPRHLDAIDEVLTRTRHMKPQQATRREFDHPVLNPVLAEIFEIMRDGRGVAIVAGLTPDRYSEEDLERVYWGFGTHWGVGVTQSALGDKLGRVTHTPVGPENPTNRAYRSTEELTLHTDANEIVGLMSVRKAASGGFSQLVSAPAIHNEIQRTRPELLPPLYEGFYYAAREHRGTGKAVTARKIPVFSLHGGLMSCQYVREFMRKAAEIMGTSLRDDLVEAMDAVDEIAHRPEMKLRFMLEPGEMMVFNNYVVLHSRTSFEDSPERKRLLLRLWLDVPNGRAVIPEYHREAKAYQDAAAA